MASPNLSEIITTTLRNRSKTLADNVTNHNALLRRLRENGTFQLLLVDKLSENLSMLQTAQLGSIVVTKL